MWKIMLRHQHHNRLSKLFQRCLMASYASEQERGCSLVLSLLVISVTRPSLTNVSIALSIGILTYTRLSTLVNVWNQYYQRIAFIWLPSLWAHHIWTSHICLQHFCGSGPAVRASLRYLLIYETAKKMIAKKFSYLPQIAVPRLYITWAGDSWLDW